MKIILTFVILKEIECSSKFILKIGEMYEIWEENNLNSSVGNAYYSHLIK